VAPGITDYVRPCHDMRHSALTTLAATNTAGPVLMAIAGHKSFATTKRYIHLAGVVFPDEMAALEQRLLGAGTAASRAELSYRSFYRSGSS
jgi:integrase